MSQDQYGVPIIVSSDQTAIPLQKIRLGASGGEAGYNENWLQKLVFEHPECLPVAELDAVYSRIVPICREMNTPAGPVDVLYATPEGQIILLEAKLWRNPEARRKVIAQILDYAKELCRWTYQDLEKEVRAATKRSGNVLYELVSERYPGLDEAKFHDQVSRNLARGRVMLLIVGDGIREGVGAITDFLEQFATLEFSLGLVELSVFRLDQERFLVQPRVLVKSLTIKRSVFVSQAGNVTVVDDMPAQSEKPAELSDLQRFYQDFWAEFIGGLHLDDTSQPFPNVTRSGNIFLNMPPSGGQAWITVFFSQADKQVGLFLTFTRGPFGDLAYERLTQDRDAIERELDVPVEWSSADGKHTISAMRTFPDLRSAGSRSDIKAFLSDRINRFVNVFRTRLTRIAEEL